MEEFLRGVNREATEIEARIRDLKTQVNLRLLALQEAEDHGDGIAQQIDEAENRYQSGEGYPDAVPADEFVRRVRERVGP